MAPLPTHLLFAKQKSEVQRVSICSCVKIDDVISNICNVPSLQMHSQTMEQSCTTVRHFEVLTRLERIFFVFVYICLL